VVREVGGPAYYKCYISFRIEATIYILNLNVQAMPKIPAQYPHCSTVLVYKRDITACNTVLLINGYTMGRYTPHTAH
jgi:hypothetical protein